MGAGLTIFILVILFVFFPSLFLKIYTNVAGVIVLIILGLFIFALGVWAFNDIGNIFRSLFGN
jgi:hypothetical protein